MVNDGRLDFWTAAGQIHSSELRDLLTAERGTIARSEEAAELSGKISREIEAPSRARKRETGCRAKSLAGLIRELVVDC
jgi:hypothetical protein